MRWRSLVPVLALFFVAHACGDDAVGTSKDTRDVVLNPDVDTVTADTTPVDTSDTAPDVTDVTLDTTPDVTDTTPDIAPDANDTSDSVTPTDVVEDTSDVPIGPREGDECALPHELADPDVDRHYDALGDIGATAGLVDAYDASSCGVIDTSVNGAGKADEVWRFVAPGTGDYLVSVLADTNIDIAFYVLDAATCETCLGYDDSGPAGDIDHLIFTLEAKQAIAIVIDGKASAHAGAYIVDVYACEGPCE